jgi:hypothetical protein
MGHRRENLSVGAGFNAPRFLNGSDYFLSRVILESLQNNFMCLNAGTDIPRFSFSGRQPPRPFFVSRDDRDPLVAGCCGHVVKPFYARLLSPASLPEIVLGLHIHPEFG